MLHRLTSEGDLLQCVIKRCTETAVSLLTESDATNSLACPEERERQDETGWTETERGREEGRERRCDREREGE